MSHDPGARGRARSAVNDRDAFVAARKERWNRLERLVAQDPRTAGEWSALSADYRSLCADLATARSQRMPRDVQDFLDDLAGRAHNRLYSVPARGVGRSILTDALHGFPRELREQGLFFALALLFFYGPLLVGILGGLADPEFAGLVLPADQLEGLEEMYSGELDRGFGGDATMAGFYVFNNVGIAFRCFATGVLFGLGPVFYLIYNGLVIGTVAGHLGSVGLGGNLLEFVSGHSAWELTGVCVAGAGGLRMGWALVSTGGRTRLGLLRAAAPGLYRIVLGAATLLLVAAAIEGFWSAGPMPRGAKYAFGLAQVGIVAAWLAFGGRRGPGEAAP